AGNATLDYINRHQALAHRHLHRDLDQLRALQRDHLEGRVPDDTYNFDRPAPDPASQPDQPSPAAPAPPPPHPAAEPHHAPAPEPQPLQPAAAPAEITSGNPDKISPETNPTTPQPSSCQLVSVARDPSPQRRFRLRGRPAAPAGRRFLTARRLRR
ncbi:MAG: hypothetical protein SFV54_17760, partial [Bryobacteraceae bacterium]|nr:hypothetical protein [Bryobacteraceae bacterium]